MVIGYARYGDYGNLKISVIDINPSTFLIFVKMVQELKNVLFLFFM